MREFIIHPFGAWSCLGGFRFYPSRSRRSIGIANSYKVLWWISTAQKIFLLKILGTQLLKFIKKKENFNVGLLERCQDKCTLICCPVYVIGNIYPNYIIFFTL